MNVIALIRIEAIQGFLQINYRTTPKYTTEIKAKYKCFTDIGCVESYSTKTDNISYLLKEAIEDIFLWIKPKFITLYFYQYCNENCEWQLVTTKILE